MPFHGATRPSSLQSPSHTLNFLGTLGAVLAVCSYSFLGSAAYLLCALFLGYGSAKLILPGTRVGRRVLWCGVFIVSGSCLAQLLNLPLLDASKLSLPGEGGWLGKFLGESILRELLGIVGASFILGCLYITSLLFMTGIRPLEVLEFLCSLPAKGREAFLKWRADRIEQKALKQAELEMSADRAIRSSAPDKAIPPANERRKTRTTAQAEKSGAEEIPVASLLEKSLPQATETPLSSLPIDLPVDPVSADPSPVTVPDSIPTPEPEKRPAPKIIDGTAPPPCPSQGVSQRNGRPHDALSGGMRRV